MLIHEIGNPYKNIPIVKVIYNDINNNLKYKIIFVGPQNNITKKLLDKLSIQGLNLNEKKQLNNVIPFYEKKFNLDNHQQNEKVKIKFIYQYLEDNYNIKQIQVILHNIFYEHIKNKTEDEFIDKKSSFFKPENQLLYYYPVNIQFKKIISILNSIFLKEEKLDKDIFIKKLLNLFSFKNVKQLNDEINKINPKSKFLNKSVYIYTDLINDNMFHKLCVTIPKLLTINYYFFMNEKKINSYLYYHINRVLNNNIHFSPSKMILDDDINYFYDTIFNDDKIFNNELFLYTKDDLSKKLNEDFINYYFPSHLKVKMDDSIFLNTIENFNKLLESSQKKNQLKLIHSKSKNLIVDIYSNNLNISPELDLKLIFNNFETNLYLPIIKYYIKNEPVNFKINKDFIKKHDYLEINSLLMNKIHPKIKNLIDIDYIQFKWRISKQFILTINLYKTGYIISFFDNTNYIDIKLDVIPYLKLINSTIKKIKNLIMLKYIPQPNLESLLTDIKPKFIFNNLITSNFQINFKIVKLNQDINAIIKLFSKIVKSNYYHFIVNETSYNTIKLLYKQTDKFYHPSNITQFINRFYIKNNNNINNKTKDLLVKYLKSIFYIDETQINDYIDNRNLYDIHSTSDFLYGIEIVIRFVTNNEISISYDNITNINTVKKLNYYLEIIFNIIISKFEKISEIQNNKLKDNKNNKQTNNNNDLDIELDLENEFKLSDEFDLDVGLDIDFDLNLGSDEELNLTEKEELDSNFNKEISDIYNLLSINENEDTQSKNSIEEFKGIEIKKFDLNKKLKFKEYMKNMRRHFDKDLYEVKDEKGKILYSYGIADCDNKQMRQPYIVTKQELDMYDPESITGYIKYRNNYYICPRIWDIKANAPISVKKFIENGYKSPYNKGLPIPPEKRDKYFLGDEYTVIIRKGTTDTYWQDETVKNNWNNILKGTEKDAYPALMKPIKHPKKLCVPCCGKKPAKDFDPNKKELQQFFKPIGFEKCNLDYKKEEKQNHKNIQNNTLTLEYKQSVDSDNFSCFYINNIYILGYSSILEKCKYGLLSKNLDIMLNNHQNLFLSKTGSNLLDKCSVFLRRGINNNNKKYNILETWSVITRQSLNSLINTIVNNITPELFIDLNKGDLIDIYSSSNILPYSVEDLDKFKLFCHKYTSLLNIFEFDYEIIEKLEYQEVMEMKDNKDQIESVKKLIMIYKIYKSFYNFISHILNKNEYKNYLHFLDLLSRPLKWISPYGSSIILFDNNNHLICNPYFNKTKKVCMMIMYNKFKFIPIVYCKNLGKEIKIKGIFNIDNINIEDYEIQFHNNKYKTNKELLNNTKNRKNSFLELINIQNEICYSTRNNFYIFINKLAKLINIDKKIIDNTTQIEYIYITSNKNSNSDQNNKNNSKNNEITSLLLPIYPLNYGAIDTISNINFLKSSLYSKLEMYLQLNNFILNKKPFITDYDFKITGETFKKLITVFKNHKYTIKNILLNLVTNKIVGLKFNNNLVVPVIPIKYDENIKKSLVDVYNIDIDKTIETVLYDFNYTLNEEFMSLTLNNLFVNDLKYNNFKYQFSRIINLIQHKNEYNRIKNLVINNHLKHKYDKNELITILKKKIINVMKEYVSKLKKSKQKNNSNNNKNKKTLKNTINKPYIFKKIYKTKKKYCKNDLLTILDDTKKGKYICKLKINSNELEYFSYLLSIDMIINHKEFLYIINGSYIPIFNENNNIFLNDKEIQIRPKELVKYIEKSLFSQFKQNYLLKFEKNKKYEEKLDKNSIKQISDRIEKIKEILNNSLKQLINNKNQINNDNLDINTTVFDKDGIYNDKMNIGVCNFPFKNPNISRGNKLTYKCINSNDNSGLVCPVKLDNKLNPIKWGYCPENISSSILKDKIVTYGDEFERKYKTGICQIPFLNRISREDNNKEEDIIKLQYKCVENKDYSWCPILKENNNKKNNINSKNEEQFYKAATNITNIKYNAKMPKNFIKLKNNTTIINPTYLTHKRKGYCSTPKNVKITKKKNLFNINNNDIELITLENYKPNKCNMGIKKGGYSKIQLYLFGLNVLNIDKNLMLDGDIIIKKDILCNLINKEFRNLKKNNKIINEEELLNIYTKDINKCMEPENKGGYYKNDLIDMAINYFDLNQEKAEIMSKKELCDYISKKIKTIKKSIDSKLSISSSSISNKLSNNESKKFIYPGKIESCKYVPERGGFKIKKLKEIARKYFDIDTTELSKEEICDKIETKLKEKSNNIKIKNNILNKGKINKVLNKFEKNDYDEKNNDDAEFSDDDIIDINY